MPEEMRGRGWLEGGKAAPVGGGRERRYPTWAWQERPHPGPLQRAPLAGLRVNLLSVLRKP